MSTPSSTGPPIETNLDSFVLRFVRESNLSAGASDWHGVIRHVQSSRERTFTRWTDAVDFIAQFVDVDLKAQTGEA